MSVRTYVEAGTALVVGAGAIVSTSVPASAHYVEKSSPARRGFLQVWDHKRVHVVAYDNAFVRAELRLGERRGPDTWTTSLTVRDESWNWTAPSDAVITHTRVCDSTGCTKWKGA